jgi:hypothetical protein
MTLLATESVTQAPVPTPVRAPVLITEQQVLLGSAAAGLRVTPAPHWLRALSAIFARPAREDRWKARTYPAQHRYLEAARMSREMYRL